MSGGRDGALPRGTAPERLVDEVRRTLDAALAPASRVLLGLSGGADSVGLAVLVTRARPDLDAHALHVRHGLRDDAEDALRARECAVRLGLRFREVAVDARHVPGGKGPEAAARAARYAAFRQAAAEIGASAVLVAHTAEDQAETVLLNLARGAGLPGAAGMAADRTDASGLRILRPLLTLRREDVRAVTRDSGIAWAEDPTNADPAQRRARARRDVLPALETLTGERGDAVAALSRFAAHARREGHALQVLAEREFGRIGRRWGPVLALPRTHLAAMPEGLALRVLRLVVADLGAPVLRSAQLQAVLTLKAGQSVHTRGLRVTAGGGWLALGPEDIPPLAPRPVALPGRTALGELDLALWTDVEREPVDPRHVASGPPGSRLPLHARLPVPGDAGLALRPRRPGDRMRLRQGTRPVQDLLTDAGVPRLLRDLLPLLVDERDEPVWIPGVAVARMPESLSHVRAWIGPAAARGAAPGPDPAR